VEARATIDQYQQEGGDGKVRQLSEMKISQKGVSEMKTMVQNKTANQPQIREKVDSGRSIREQAKEQADVTTEQKQAPPKAIPEVKPNQGLCSTCNEAPHCVYAKNATSPILYCEMFDDSQPEEKAEIGHSEDLNQDQDETETKTVQENPSHGQLKGLCVNCDHRHHCTFPKPEGGIWHCEEYC
jgi:hypothetical protein